MQGWGPRPGLAWSLPAPCALATRPGSPRLSQTWTTSCQGTCPLPGQRPTQRQVVVAWWWQPWCIASFGPAIILCWAATPAPFWFCPHWLQILWGTSWIYVPPVWARQPRSTQPSWPLSARSWPSLWSTWAPLQMQHWLWELRPPRTS